MTLDQVEAKMKTRLPQFRGFGHRAAFDFGKDGVLVLDATKTPATLARGDAPADCTIRISLADLEKMVGGQLNPTLAFATGRLKVSGSMGLALKLAALLDDE
jgi:putative sterol carrier protein